MSSQFETIANLAMGKGIENGLLCAKKSRAPIALNYLVALKDLLSILEESIMVGIQGGERIREVSSMQGNNI